MEKDITKVRKSFSIRLNQSDIIVRLLLFIVSIFLCFVVNSTTQIKCALFFLLALNVYLVIVSRKQLLSLIISLFLLWFNYSIYFANYILQIEDMFTEWAYTDVGVTGFKIVLLFMGTLCLFIKTGSSVHSYKKFNPTEKNACLFTNFEQGHMFVGCAYLIVLLSIFIFGFDVPAEDGVRGYGSTYFEYSVILFIVGFYFFGWSKAYKLLSSCLALLYALIEMFYGGRVTALQLLLILFLFYFDGKKIPWLKLIPIGILFLAAFSLIGSMRGEVKFSFANLLKSLTSFNDNFGVLDTAYSAYFTSLTFVKVENFVGVEQRLIMFVKFCLSMLFGGSIISDANLANFTHQYYTHYFGGVLPFFGQFYLGWIGVVLFAGLVAFYINKINNIYAQKGPVKCVLVYIAITTPRWYLYSPSNLIRGAFLLLIVYYCTLIASKAVTKHN